MPQLEEPLGDQDAHDREVPTSVGRSTEQNRIVALALVTLFLLALALATALSGSPGQCSGAKGPSLTPS